MMTTSIIFVEKDNDLIDDNKVEVAGIGTGKLKLHDGTINITINLVYGDC